jgi:type I restriction enzyme, S subunit
MVKNNQQNPPLRFKQDSGQSYQDWQTHPLGEIADKRFQKNLNNNIKKVFTNSANYGIVNQLNYFDKDIANHNNLDNYYIIHNNDFIYNPRISIFAPVGPLKRNHNNGLGLVSPLYTVFFFKNEIINLDFIENYFNTPKWHNYLKSVANYGVRSDRMNITNKDFFNIPIPLPSSIEEQTKIGNFLKSVDDKITLQNKSIEKLKRYKTALMQQLFPQHNQQNPPLRFKQANGQSYQDWHKVKIKDIFMLTRGQVLAKKNISKIVNFTNKYPVYSSQTLNNGLLGFFNQFLFEDAITWTTDGAGAGDVKYRSGKFYCTNVCGVLINKEGYANHCIATVLNKVSRKYVSYVGNPKLMNNVMSDIIILIPKSLEEQTKIGNFLKSVDDKITLQNKSIEKLKNYKTSLMQQLFPST